MRLFKEQNRTCFLGQVEELPDSSLLSCSCSAGCSEGLVTPGMWGRQQGGVRAIGEFRHSKRNFRS